MDFKKPSSRRKRCPHCNALVPANVFSRNHGSKCPYKDAPKGEKLCKGCQKFVAIESFALVSNNTYDGRNGTCNQCLGKRYYYPKKAVSA